MVYWNRFISYIYRYHDGHKCENSGFAKVAKVGRTGRLTVGLRNGMNSREEIYGVFIYRETLADEGAVGGEQTNEPVMIPLPVLVGKMRLRNGHGEECFSFCWDDVMESGRPVTAFAGIVIRRIQPDGNMGQEYYDSDIFCSSWTDSVIDYSRMWDAKRAGRDAEELSEAVREASITDTVTAELELESCAAPAEFFVYLYISRQSRSPLSNDKMSSSAVARLVASGILCSSQIRSRQSWSLRAVLHRRSLYVLMRSRPPRPERR